MPGQYSQKAFAQASLISKIVRLDTCDRSIWHRYAQKFQLLLYITHFLTDQNHGQVIGWPRFLHSFAQAGRMFFVLVRKTTLLPISNTDWNTLKDHDAACCLAKEAFGPQIENWSKMSQEDRTRETQYRYWYLALRWFDEWREHKHERYKSQQWLARGNQEKVTLQLRRPSVDNLDTLVRLCFTSMHCCRVIDNLIERTKGNLPLRSRSLASLPLAGEKGITPPNPPPTVDEPPPLTEAQERALDQVREHGPIPGKELAQKVHVSPATIRRWTQRGGPLHAHGVVNPRNGEGYIMKPM